LFLVLISFSDLSVKVNSFGKIFLITLKVLMNSPLRFKFVLETVFGWGWSLGDGLTVVAVHHHQGLELERQEMK
jgi:hypothetical protein